MKKKMVCSLHGPMARIATTPIIHHNGPSRLFGAVDPIPTSDRSMDPIPSFRPPTGQSAAGAAAPLPPAGSFPPLNDATK